MHKNVFKNVTSIFTIFIGRNNINFEDQHCATLFIQTLYTKVCMNIVQHYNTNTVELIPQSMHIHCTVIILTLLNIVHQCMHGHCTT